MAARKAPLRVAKPGEKPPERKQPETLSEAAKSGERDLLVTLRAKIAKELDAGVPAAYLAPISRQLRDIDKEIRMLDKRLEEEADEDGVTPDEEWDAEAL